MMLPSGEADIHLRRVFDRMKWNFSGALRMLLLTLSLVLILMPVVGVAEILVDEFESIVSMPEAVGNDVPMPEDGASLQFFDWQTIGTFSGAVAATVFVVQMLKVPIDKLWHIPTQYVVYVVSLSILILAQLFLPGGGGFAWYNLLPCIFNAVLVSLTAMSTYTKLIEDVELAKYQGMYDEIILETAGAAETGAGSPV